jgi:cytidylate kinase
MKPLDEMRILIVGLGLIGGSIARGLRSGKVCGAIDACGRDAEPLRRAVADGVIDRWSSEPQALTGEADMIVLCVPTLSIRPVLRVVRQFARSDAIITDAASVKGSVVEDVRAVFGADFPLFVPAHPIAGSEKSGYSASTAHLYQGRKVILTPTAATAPEALEAVSQLWQKLGAEVHTLSVQDHDAVLAGTSHLPHLLAFSLVNTLSRQALSDDIFRYAAGGFAGFTRIASSDPSMWRDIFLANGPATVALLDAYTADLARMREAILSGEAEFLMHSFVSAKQTRDHFVSRHFQESEPELASGSREAQRSHTVIPVLTIDGPGGSGKGTISTRVAAHLGWHFLDSGALYRLLGLAAARSGVSTSDESALLALAGAMQIQFELEGGRIWLDGQEVSDQLRDEVAGRAASEVAVIPSIRQALLARQHQFRQWPGLVADGRDMGTVVFPEAQLKVFLTASAEERAKRRYKQLIDKGIDVNLSALFLDIQARDERDSTRSVSPLRPAEDAVTVDTTSLSIEQVVQRVLELVEERFGPSREKPVPPAQ